MFCEIVQGEIYSKMVQDEEEVLAFEDIISARVSVHGLVVPKKRGSSGPQMGWLLDTVARRIFEVAHGVTKEQGMVEWVAPSTSPTVPMWGRRLSGCTPLSWVPRG